MAWQSELSRYTESSFGDNELDKVSRCISNSEVMNKFQNHNVGTPAV